MVLRSSLSVPLKCAGDPTSPAQIVSISSLTSHRYAGASPSLAEEPPLIAEEVRFQALARLVIADVLDARDPLAEIVDIDLLDEVATVHPINDRPSSDLAIRARLRPLQVPRADHYVQRAGSGIRRAG
jgi:hypothetical protein